MNHHSATVFRRTVPLVGVVLLFSFLLSVPLRAGPPIELPDLLAIEAPAPGIKKLRLNHPAVRRLLINQADAGGARLKIALDPPGRFLHLGPNLVTWTAKDKQGQIVGTRTEYVYLFRHGQTPVATTRGPAKHGPEYATGGNHGPNVVRGGDGSIHVAWRDRTQDADEPCNIPARFCGYTVKYTRGRQNPHTGAVRWTTPPMDISQGTDPDEGSYPAMAASRNAIHFVWSPWDSKARYRRARREGNDWVLEPVQNAGAIGWKHDNAPDIAVFGDKEVHIVSPQMEYAYSLDVTAEDPVWHVEDLWDRLPVGTTGVKYPAITIDPRGHIHIVVSAIMTNNYVQLWYLHRDRPSADGPGPWLEEHAPLATFPEWQDPGPGDRAVIADWVDIEADASGNLHVAWHGTAFSGAFGKDDAFYMLRPFAADLDPRGWEQPEALHRNLPGDLKFSFSPSISTDAKSNTAFPVFMVKALGEGTAEDYDDLDSALRVLRDGVFIDEKLRKDQAWVPLSDAAHWPMATWWPTAAPTLYRGSSNRVWLDVVQTMKHLDSPDELAFVVHQRLDVTKLVKKGRQSHRRHHDNH